MALDRPRRTLHAAALAVGVALACPFASGAAFFGGSTAGAATVAPTAYVANSGNNTTTPISLPTNAVGSPISGGGSDFPLFNAITPNGQTVYSTNNNSDTVTPISTATNTAGSPITVGPDPTGLAITPNGQTAYAASFTDNTW